MLDRARDLTGVLVDVPEPVRFVDNDKIPCRLLNVGLLRTRELIGADDDRRLAEMDLGSPSDFLVESSIFKNSRRQEELIRELLAPLLAQIGRHDHEKRVLRSAHFWASKNARLRSFSEPNLVREDRALRKRGAEREERSFNLVRVQIDLSVQQRGLASFSTLSEAQRFVSS